jgi:5-methylcytosine-specific restriction endonuclease McrBC GTP-binding regulatory subunit McrB
MILKKNKMNNPFNVSEEKLKKLLNGYSEWLQLDQKEANYPEDCRLQSQKIKEDFLNIEVLKKLSDANLYERIFSYSRKLEGPVHMRLGEKRLHEDLPEIRRNLEYILTSKDSPFAVAQKILHGEYKIEVFAKAFWSPILQTRFPDVLPNWNNKTERFLKNFKINISISKLSVAEKYKIISGAFKYLSGLKAGNDFYTINHMMHYGTEITEGKSIIEEILQNEDQENKIKLLDLKGKRFYKISHGVFIKRPQFVKAGLLDILEKNNWISMGLDTGKGQTIEFIENAHIGDYVYVCYGGNDVYCVGKIVSNSKPFDKINNDKLDIEEGWIYREIEPLYFPENGSVSELKTDTRFFMPSGNSTFYEVPKDQLEYINEKIFIPKFKLKVVDKSIEKKSPETNSGSPESVIQKPPLNTILYGPPGTGKTYHCVSHAVAIIEGKAVEDICKEERKEIKSRFEQYREEGRIVFTTFHQSLGYEDFIEGIKPIEPSSEEEQLTYAVEDGIFKKLSNEASFSFVKKTTKTETEHVLDFSKEYDKFIDSVNEELSKGKSKKYSTRSGGNIQIESISQKNNIWVSHIDGTRNYTVSKKRLSKLSKAFPDLNEISNINEQFRAEIGGSNALAYWAILNAIRKQSSKYPENEEVDETKYSYEDKKQVIETLVNQDYMAENPKQYVLIIDEINRGNVSQVFGELITLIEDDKRMGKNEALKIILPYSKEEFGVPCNLYIIGTMNTADRSVEALDSALRRRFSFIEINPKPEKLNVTVDGINLAKMLEVLNRRLAVLKDNDHTIGHAWFWNVTNFMELKGVFGNKILPLLKEYFYNDYEKLGLVLGDAFFKIKEQVNSKMFASFSGGNSLADQYDQAWQYQLKSINELTVSDFKSLEIQDTETESTNV